jgi:hypothetical protein
MLAMPEPMASLTITVHMDADLQFTVEIPDADGSEFARTFGSTAREALGQAGQYVEAVLFEFAPATTERKRGGDE